ncbi:PAS domain-containing sensor histidine kinase [Clostridium sp. DJ247]|uniref:PAS domain-containing sensor histidine kinase n=1 Tax=Clostridium sp. DJ247 TaxID=2726188 RepID=UPI00162621B9|nr:PAS domain-containing sensor histidine kinase [Clostridium sp. DJ247]MBC2582393.1 PAS domain S-box protein [Clostridium sp. DJ247]
MENFEWDLQKNVYNLLSITKLALLLICAIIAFNEFFSKITMASYEQSGYLNVVTLGIGASTIILIYCIWLFFSMKTLEVKYIKILSIIENIIFIIVFTALIFISGAYASQYKFLFLFLIITSTIQLGAQYGVAISIISSIIILSVDLICSPKMVINTYFENDLIIVSILILTAWILGYYVTIGNKRLKQKNMQLQVLNKELCKREKQRKYIEEMFLKNEACYNILIENSHEAIFVHRNEKVIFANESAAKMVGMSKAEQMNETSILDYIPVSERESIREKFDEMYDEKVNIVFIDGKIVMNNGNTIEVQNMSTAFIYEGEPTVLSIIRDVTPEKQVEKLQKDVEKNIELLNETREFNKFITEFFSNISHELKTPLNVIFSALQVLNLYDNSPEEFAKIKEKYMKVMRQNCYRLMKLINNLLDITRVDSGFLKLNLQNHDIISVVEEITLSVVSYVESKGINLVFDTDEEEKIVAFDADKIERIMLNLLSNAIKFTNPGGEIYVNIKNLEDNVIISVKDTGVGIPEDKLNVIFERFGQVDKTFKRNKQGSGIGLSLVKSFVEMHGGKINVKSTIGAGSEFIVNLPVKVLDEDMSEEDAQYKASIESISMELSDVYSELA